MLREVDSQLLTAYVDGELTARERRRVVRLLRQSREARRFVRRLRRDARLVGSLRVPPLPVDLSEVVLQTIAARGLKPGTRRPARRTVPPRFPAWVGLAAAAAVFLAVSLGSYLFFSSGPAGTDPGPVAVSPSHPRSPNE